MDASTGKRAANKIAVRQALQAAADRLFAERGYAATTVSDIAVAAGVTERTFFRYFQGKEELILDDVLAGLPVLADLIRARPVDEPPPVAVERATVAAAQIIGRTGGTSPLLLFTDGPPAARLSQARPQLLIRIERAVADALRSRLEAAGDPDPEFRSELYARLCVAALRSAAVRDWQLRRSGAADRADMEELVHHAFSALRPLV